MSVDVMSDDGSRVVDNNSVVISLVGEEAAVSPVSVARVVVTIDVVDDGVILVVPVT
jgi:hypothetical protein